MPSSPRDAVAGDQGVAVAIAARAREPEVTSLRSIVAFVNIEDVMIIITRSKSHRSAANQEHSRRSMFTVHVIIARFIVVFPV